MSAVSPVIAEWNTLGLDWIYITQAKYGALTLTPGAEIRLPIADYAFNYPEGILLNFTTYFDHPDCGIKLSSGSEYDTAEEFTVTNIAQGLTSPEWQIYALVPPDTLPGVFGLRLVQPHFFTDWLRISVINPSSVSHRSTSQKYQLAVLTRKRSSLTAHDMKTIDLLLQLYPEMKGGLQDDMRRILTQYIRTKQFSATIPGRKPPAIIIPREKVQAVAVT